MAQSYTCPRCGEQSDDPLDCSECGASIPAATAAIGDPVTSQATSSSAGSSTASVKAQARPHVTRVGGYTGLTVRATGARRPQASTASFTGSKTGTGVGSGSTRHRGSRGSSSRRRSLGGGLVQMPVMPSQDPLLKLMVNPVIPDAKCFCPNCKIKVNPAKRFCSNCGTEYSFKPALRAGDVVAGQYDIRGAMAFGGLGWIYLAQDRRVNDRWVVLKGLLNTRDEASAAAAVAERQFLSSIKHGKIVGIYNFTTHGSESYIVMEYVGGRTLKDIRKENGPLPPEQAISYIIGILPAFGYLHEQKMVYCDFSPDNVMLEGDDVKLIDLGATRRIGDRNGDIFGKEGYMAPEASYDPYEPSDLFTIGRTLANLMFDMSMRLTGPVNWTVPADGFVSRGVPAEQITLWNAALEGGDALPGWLKFDAATRTFSGRAPAGMLQIAVQITPMVSKALPWTDPDGKSVIMPMDIVIPLALPEPQDVRFEIPQARFRTEGGDISASTWDVKLADGSPLPPWLRREGVVVSGRAPDGVTAVELMVSCTDAAGVKTALPFTVRLPFAESESLYRFMLKATAYDPDARFQTAEEMSSQLTGVLREIVSVSGPVPAAEDPEFLSERIRSDLSTSVVGMWRRLPELRIDESDSARSEVFAAGGTADSDKRMQLISTLCNKKPDSAEAQLRHAALLIDKGFEENEIPVLRMLDRAAAIDPWDWRPDWYCGLMRMMLGQTAEAIECFDRVYSDIPGSQAPKLALGMALEQAGRYDEAAGLYETVSRTEPAMTSAAFGLARCRTAVQDRTGAVSAYARVPEGVSSYAESRLASARVLVSPEAGPVQLADLEQASSVMTGVVQEDIPRYMTEVTVLLAAADYLVSGGVTNKKDILILDVPMKERALRKRAEEALRLCAKRASSAEQRIAFIDAANTVRPQTFW